MFILVFLGCVPFDHVGGGLKTPVPFDSSELHCHPRLCLHCDIMLTPVAYAETISFDVGCILE